MDKVEMKWYLFFAGNALLTALILASTIGPISYGIFGRDGLESALTHGFAIILAVAYMIGWMPARIIGLAAGLYAGPVANSLLGYHTSFLQVLIAVLFLSFSYGFLTTFLYQAFSIKPPNIDPTIQEENRRVDNSLYGACWLAVFFYIPSLSAAKILYKYYGMIGHEPDLLSADPYRRMKVMH